MPMGEMQSSTIIITLADKTAAQREPDAIDRLMGQIRAVAIGYGFELQSFGKALKDKQSMGDATIIGRLPQGVTVLDRAFFRGMMVLATSDGVYIYDGSNPIYKLEPPQLEVPLTEQDIIDMCGVTPEMRGVR